MESTEDRPYVLPLRDPFDLVGANDLACLLTAVHGVNPFDTSPGLLQLTTRKDERPRSANPLVLSTSELRFDRATLSTVRDAKGNSLLHVAASHGFTQMAEELFNLGEFSVDVRNDDGFTALHLAARGGHTTMVQQLWRKAEQPLLLTGSVTPLFEERARTALFLAHWRGHTATVAVLAPLFAAGSPLRRPPLTSADVITGRLTSSEGSAEQILTDAAMTLRTTPFALLFETVDCSQEACGRFPVVVAPQWVQVLRCCAGRLLHLLLSTAAADSTSEAAQQFIVEGLLAHQLVTFGEPSVCNEVLSLVPALAAGGRTGLLRLLLAHGLPLGSVCEAVQSSLEVGSNVTAPPEDVQLLLREASTRIGFNAALAAALRKPRSVTLKKEAIAEKQHLHECRRLLSDRKLVPL